MSFKKKIKKLCDLSPFGEYVLLVLYHFCDDDLSEYVKPFHHQRIKSDLCCLQCDIFTVLTWPPKYETKYVMKMFTIWGRNLLGSNTSFRLVDCWPGKLKEKYELLQACCKHFAVS